MNCGLAACVVVNKTPMRGHPVALANPGHPAGPQSLQPHRPGISSRFPDRRQDGEHLLAIARPSSSRAPLRLLSRRRSVQKDESRISGGNRCSSRIRSASLAWLRAQLCGNARRPFGNIPTSPCTPIQPSSQLLSRVHPKCLDGPSPVTFSMPRYAHLILLANKFIMRICNRRATELTELRG